MKPQEFSSFSLVRTHSIRCTSVCTMNRLSRVYVQVDHTIRTSPHVSIFFWKCESFFVFAVSKIYPFTRSVFDTVTSSFSKSSVLKSPHENTKTVLSTWNHRIRKVPFLHNTQIFWSKLSSRNNFEFSAFLCRWKLFEGCYRMTEIPESSVQKLEDRLNNNGCINFCRDKAFPLAATSNKQCVCLNSLPTTLLAISTDGDAASGPSSSCNIKCPGDAGESCFRTSCCGGPEQAYSIYATGGEWCVIQLKITPRRSRRASSQNDFWKKFCLFRCEGISIAFIVIRSEDIEIITVAITFCSCAVLND